MVVALLWQEEALSVSLLRSDEKPALSPRGRISALSKSPFLSDSLREQGWKETPMYPVVLYGSLPEIAYLAPRGSFLARPAPEEERPSRRPNNRPVGAPREDGETPQPKS